MAPGTLVTGKMVSALRDLGFDHVFDTDFAADLTIMEEGSELLDRLTRFHGVHQIQGGHLRFHLYSHADELRRQSHSRKGAVHGTLTFDTYS